MPLMPLDNEGGHSHVVPCMTDYCMCTWCVDVLYAASWTVN
ncbi:unnamed protein product [Chondrus crispus]|uniref:Uncharacterized protein n=1 Tax=Chondrus crispus TaxID=2769 RepID=R7QM83_CHOCR|nr:unnamed protein product [Chondrus crispus]CDF38586.1 unnamed protein product [Chondrus crispus]|eukprot:XP_005718491.1 unnamed protein product [Chondrus crispus]